MRSTTEIVGPSCWNDSQDLHCSLQIVFGLNIHSPPSVLSPREWNSGMFQDDVVILPRWLVLAYSSLSQQHVNRYHFCLFQIWVQMKRIGAKVISLFVLLVLFELWQKLTFNTWWNMRLTPGLDAVKSALCFDVQQQMTATTGTAVLLNWLLFKYNLKRGTCKVSASASKELYELWAMLFSALHFFSGFVIKTQSIMKETLNPWWLSLLFIATVDEPVCCSQLPFGVPVLNDHLSIFVVSLTFCFCLIPVSQLWGRSCCMWTGWMASSGTLRQSSGCTLWLAQRYSREYIQNK